MSIQHHQNKPLYLHPKQIKEVLKQVAHDHNFWINNLSYHYMSDEELLFINKKYLNHDYYTDVITFDLSDQSSELWADVCISVDRTEDNAQALGVTPELELVRVIIHAALHLVGYNDSNQDEKNTIRQKEDAYLNLYKKFRFHVEQ